MSLNSRPSTAKSHGRQKQSMSRVVQKVMSTVAEKDPLLLIKLEKWINFYIKEDEIWNEEDKERETYNAEARLAELQ